MTLKDTDPGVTAYNSSDSPGRMIAHARESHNISAADLANRLRLDPKIIRAIERDDYESLPSATFVKGYMRSIAKELDMDAARVLDAYSLHASTEPPKLADFSSRPPPQIGVNSTIIKFATYALITVLAVLIGLWWRSNYTGTTNGDVARVPADVEFDDGAPQPLPYDFQIVEHDDSTWQSPPPDPSGQEPIDSDETQNTTQDAMQAGAHALRISTTSEAWVEIYDREGARLYFGMANSDRPVSVGGHDYYRLVLGNTDSVELQMDGQPVDLAPYSTQGVAQLELGTAGAEPEAVE